MKLKRCEPVVSLEQAAKDVYCRIHCDKIYESIKDLLAGLTTYKELSKSEKQTLDGQKQNAIGNIKHTRKMLDAYIDKMEATAKKMLKPLVKIERRF